MLPQRLPVSAGLLSFALVLATVHLAAQSVVTISPQQCVWHAGDNPAWSAPNLDESSWQPYATWKSPPGQTQMWARCHADLAALQSVAHPAIQLYTTAAYQLYIDGVLVGSAGNLESGNFSVDTMRAFPVNTNPLWPGPSTVALRMVRRLGAVGMNSNLVLSLPAPRLEIRVGDLGELEGVRARTVLNRISQDADVAICYGIIGVIAVMLLGLFIYDRSRYELLLLSVSCLCTAALRLNEFAAAALLNYSFLANRVVYTASNCIQPFVQLLFFFVLARRRVPRLFWILAVATTMVRLWTAAPVFLGSQPLWFARYGDFIILLAGPINVALSLAPFVAFWPYARLTPRVRPVAALCMLWGIADGFWFAVQATQSPLLGLPQLFGRWSGAMLDVRGFVTSCVLAALLGLLFREQRLVVVERAQMAGELASAREIQQYLIPEKLPPTPGLAIESVYLPSREVGGDFFQVLPDPRDGSTLLVMGDVAGKGLKAGMLAALIVGAIRTAFKFTGDAGEILALLNERLQGRGLVTCMAMRIERDGSVMLANAGQLPPYINGKELPMEGTLPLGAVPGIAFPTMRFELAAGESMLLVSDGVVEARNATGELFGFDRTRSISTESAAKVAEAAQAFGQEDDITVLTLSFAPAEVVHA